MKMLHSHIDEDVTSIEAELRQALRNSDEDLIDFRNEVKSRLKGLKNMLTNLESARAGQATQHSLGTVPRDNRATISSVEKTQTDEKDPLLEILNKLTEKVALKDDHTATMRLPKVSLTPLLWRHCRLAAF